MRRRSAVPGDAMFPEVIARGDPQANETERPGERAGARRCAVLLNTTAGGAGGDDVAEKVRSALAGAGLVATILTPSGGDLIELARRAAADPAVDVVVAAGGDGTVSAVAGVLAGTEKPLAVLPVGTLNHFAKDLCIPPDLEGAAAIIASASPRRVDVGEVNGRVFVNNSSVGVYSRAVREREWLRARVGAFVGKWLAMGWAATSVLLRLRPMSVRIRWSGGEVPRRTPFVFVGNNKYDTAAVSTQRRDALDRAVLGVYVGKEQTRLGLVRLALRAITGRADGSVLEAFEVRDLELETRRRTLHVSVDGEVVRTTAPIRYRIRPGALQVLAPPTTPRPA
jgi:diacylglycerol kinase family enzyme